MNRLRRHAAFRVGLFVVALGLASCQRPWVCDEVDEQRTNRLPLRLSETGLFASVESETLAAGVVAYRPRFSLWSDGSTKRRWFKLPPGSRIDTSDMDSWSFPVGTKFWKEFTRDGVRVETRLLQKVGPDDWDAVAYAWRSDQREADAVPYGVIDSGGTPHDVPAANECNACHGGRRSFVLGFSAIGLSSLPAGELDLDALVAANLLTTSPAGPIVVPGNDTQREALGYLHANCSHCHNARRPERNGARCYAPENALDFSLDVGALASPSDTATYRTAVGSVIEPGQPDSSRLFSRMSHRGGFRQMPPLATERVDSAGVALLTTWIAGM